LDKWQVAAINRALGIANAAGGSLKTNQPVEFIQDPIVGDKSFKHIIDMKNRKRQNKKQKGGVIGLSDSEAGITRFLPGQSDFVTPAVASLYGPQISDNKLTNENINKVLRECLATRSDSTRRTSTYKVEANTSDIGQVGFTSKKRFNQLVDCIGKQLLGSSSASGYSTWYQKPGNPAISYAKPPWPAGETKGICTYTKVDGTGNSLLDENGVIADQVRKPCSLPPEPVTGYSVLTANGGGTRKSSRPSKIKNSTLRRMANRRTRRRSSTKRSTKRSRRSTRRSRK